MGTTRVCETHILALMMLQALIYREVGATTCGRETRVDEDLRPARMDYPRLISEVSKTLLEAIGLTVMAVC